LRPRRAATARLRTPAAAPADCRGAAASKARDDDDDDDDDAAG
jgi:hypothetical protein